jgi:hypothetical protein
MGSGIGLLIKGAQGFSVSVHKLKIYGLGFRVQCKKIGVVEEMLGFLGVGFEE